MDKYDVVVIGCGPAGQTAAVKCAIAGKRTALVDRRQVVGGRCLHVGTIPSKTMRHAIIYLSGYYERRIYGGDYRVKQEITVDDLLYRCHAIVRREIEVIQGQLQRSEVMIYTGEGSFLGPHVLQVSGAAPVQLESDSFIICAGSAPHLELDLPFDNSSILNTDDILSLSYLPRRMVILGGGVIGLEYASMFSLLDIEVTVVTPHNALLPWIDRQLADALMLHLQRHGVKILFNEHCQGAEVVDDRHVRCSLQQAGVLDTELLLYAAPRWGNTEPLNLAAANLSAASRGCLEVNGSYQTAVPHIYAAGDVIGWPALASTAIEQGRKAANHLLGMMDEYIDPLIPCGIYTFPDISMVGASEQALITSGRPYATGIGYYETSARGQILGDTEGLVKLLFDPASHELLGVHIIGAEATELVHIGQAVMINHGKVDYFVNTVFNYPTLAEVYKLAALDGLSRLPAGGQPVHS